MSIVDAPAPVRRVGDELESVVVDHYAQRYLTSTILALKNTLDWAGSEDDLAACVEGVAK